MLEFIGIAPNQLGELTDPGEIVGSLSEEGAQSVGLSTKTLAVTGAMDQAASAVGAGNLIPGLVTETTGGALAVLVTLDKPLFDPQFRVPCHCHVRRDCCCLLPWGQTAGMVLRWFRDRFFELESQVACSIDLDSYDLMTRMAARIPPGSDGLLILPHLEGAACPEFNPAARGVFFGVTLKHTKAHFVRAIMESVAYMLKKNLDIVEERGARSKLWLSIKADVLQKPVRTVASEETACLGAALIAATATGFFSSLEEAASRIVRSAPL